MAQKKYFAVFILSELYYLPVYEPVAKILKQNGYKVLFLIRKEYTHRTLNTYAMASDYLNKHAYEHKVLEDDLSDIASDFVFYSANGFKKYDFKYNHTVLMTHGIGTKGGYFIKEHTLFDIRFVEGEFREKKMLELFPDMKTKQYNVGFAKLDPAVNVTVDERNNLIEKYQLDPDKKTILYSPTFYPGSIERIKRNFPNDFEEYNIIIKPHAFSYEMNRYAKHRRIFKKWSKYQNVHLAPLQEFNLVPFMAIADVMITDESSAIFEFMALNKPVIVYRDVKLRLSYRLNKNKLKKRMEDHLVQFKDAFTNVYSYSELKPLVLEAINNPDKDRERHLELTHLLVGKTDGKVSERILKHLVEFKKQHLSDS